MKCTFIEYPNQNLPRLEVSSTDFYNDADKDNKRKKKEESNKNDTSCRESKTEYPC